MIAVNTAPDVAAGTPIRPYNRAMAPLGTFFAICRRDVFVTYRELPMFLTQVLLQPAFLVLIFGRILPDLGMASAGYANVLFPGVIVLTVVLTSLQNIALPLVLEFGYTKEIEDRLLAPLPVAFVGIQKIAIAAVRGLIAGLMIFPLGALIVGSSLHLSTGNIGLTVLGCILAAILGSAMGLTLGTLVQPNQVNMMFALIFTPLFYTGCTQYPWALLDKLQWFQIVTLFNPMTYASELLRAALAPGVAHMPIVASLPVLCAMILLFSLVGIRGFIRRSVD